MNGRAARGLRNHRAGLAAEDAVAARYEAAGGEVLARRWRAPRGSGGGEIDLVARVEGVVVFIEVKAGRGPGLRERIGPRSWARLEAAAVSYMIDTQTGDAPVRFDAAFVGPDGAVDVVENARMTEAW